MKQYVAFLQKSIYDWSVESKYLKVHAFSRTLEVSEIIEDVANDG